MDPAENLMIISCHSNVLCAVMYIILLCRSGAIVEGTRIKYERKGKEEINSKKKVFNEIWWTAFMIMQGIYKSKWSKEKGVKIKMIETFLFFFFFYCDFNEYWFTKIEMILIHWHYVCNLNVFLQVHISDALSLCLSAGTHHQAFRNASGAQRERSGQKPSWCLDKKQ